MEGRIKIESPKKTKNKNSLPLQLPLPKPLPKPLSKPLLNYTDKISKFYNISAHGINSGHFFDLPDNVVLIMPFQLENLTFNLPTDGVMWQLNLLKPDETLQNVKHLIDAYKKNHLKITGKPIDFKVYDSRDGPMKVPEIFYSPEKNKHFFSGIIECPIKIELEYVKDYRKISPISDARLKQDNHFMNVRWPKDIIKQDMPRTKLRGNEEIILIKKGTKEPINNNDVIITKIEEYIQDYLGTWRLREDEYYYNPLRGLIYPSTENNDTSVVYRPIDRYKPINSQISLYSIIKMRDCLRENEGKVLYFFSFGCNSLHKSSPINEDEYRQNDLTGVLIDEYIENKVRIPSDVELDKQEAELILKHTNKINELTNEKHIYDYINKNKLSILTLTLISENSNLHFKQIIDKIIASKITTVETKESTKKSIKEDTNIDNVIKQLKDINYKAPIPSINKIINYIIKDCSEDDINKIIFYFKNNSDDMFERQKFILNVLEHKINQFMESTLALLANNKITNKYLKYKKKYLELKKNSNE